MAHERGKKKKDFCAKPGKPCECENNYFTVCDPGWENYTYPQWVERKVNPSSYQEGYEAHHIVCVSSVMTQLYSKRGVQRVVKETTWCINEKRNMKAMPLFGHTVKHYCSIGKKVGRFIRVDLDPPPFVNIPQHDWDHNGNGSYTDEVNTSVKELANEIKEIEQDKKHDYSGDDLAEELNSLSSDFRTKLRTRGIRNAGTHLSWIEARDVEDSTNWCKPFSMASTASLKGFPARDFDSEAQDWIDRISKALRGGTA